MTTELSAEELHVLLAQGGWEISPDDLAGCVETARFLRRAAALVAAFDKSGEGPDL